MNNVNFLIQTEFSDRHECTSVTLLPPCLSPQAVLFRLSSVFVSLCLPSPPSLPPSTYSIVCFWFSMGAILVGVFFLLVDYDGMVLDNFATLISIPNHLNWV